MITIVDYGMGNLRSVEKALVHLGVPVEITDVPSNVLRAERLILPGVGAFHDAMRTLRDKGLADALKEAVGRGTPLLGLCLGMQLLCT
ncbi:imidazole glycerol phosphate synthase subunit HisH, partial [bacterium]|nr:imidazole glycerol phosphate synthase subunit HisH [bacterium]